jgi:hypothetical protein
MYESDAKAKAEAVKLASQIDASATIKVHRQTRTHARTPLLAKPLTRSPAPAAAVRAEL